LLWLALKYQKPVRRKPSGLLRFRMCLLLAGSSLPALPHAPRAVTRAGIGATYFDSPAAPDNHLTDWGVLPRLVGKLGERLKVKESMAFGMSYGLRVCGVYKIVNAANGKTYVGSTVSLKGRIYQHLSYLRSGSHPNAHLQSAFSLHGEDSFSFVLLETCTKDDLLKCEQRHLDALKPDYNICTVAGNSLGFKHGPEAKAKMTKANLGNQRRLGKHHSEETKRLIGAKAALRRHTEERRAKISAALMGNRYSVGRTLSQEHRAKVSAALRNAWADGGCRNRQAVSERMRARWADPTWKEQQIKKLTAGKAAKRGLE